MASQNTLRHGLTQEKSEIPCTIKVRNSVWNRWPELEAITIWDAFNLQNLNESYGHILNRTFPENHITIPGPDEASAPVVIEDVHDVNHLLGRNDRILQPALNLAKTAMNIRPGVSLQSAHSTADRLTLARLPNVSSRVEADHIIALDDFPLPTLVVGLGRPSSMWRGTEVASGNPRIDLMWPLRQLAASCRFGQTRYGYIQSDKEMTVCCFSFGESSEPNEAKLRVAIMPILWSRSGDEALTTDLALWWLCMLAMSPHQDHHIVRDDQMVKIDEWHEFYVNEVQGWRRRHRYSHFEEPTANNWHTLDAGFDAVLASLHPYNPENF